MKERTFFLAERKEQERRVGCALLVMELLAATQDKCPTYVQSGERERGRERERSASSIAEMATNAGSGVDRCDGGRTWNA